MQPFHHTPASATAIRVASWNLLRKVGARVEDVAALVHRHQPDLLLLQEATEDIARLPSLVGGQFFRHPMQDRIYGLAAWSARGFSTASAFRLPATVLPGGVPPRDALILEFAGVHFANVHLSHGQFLNRWQLVHIAEVLKGPAAIIGDFNAVGRVKLPGFADVGPRQKTHRSANMIPLRLDRCMARGLDCTAAQALDKGSSDHRPILLNLHIGAGAGALPAAEPLIARLRRYARRVG